VEETVSDEAREIPIILILYSSPVILTLSHRGEVPTVAERGTRDDCDIAALEQFWQQSPHDTAIMTHRPVEWNPGLMQ